MTRAHLYQANRLLAVNFCTLIASSAEKSTPRIRYVRQTETEIASSAHERRVSDSNKNVSRHL